MERSFDLGMTTIDTAPAYGFGKSEELVGRVIKGRRNNFQVLTKYGLRWDTDKGVFHFDTEDESGRELAMHKYAAKESIILECEKSLKRLGTDYIDLYQIHWPDTSTPIADTMEAVAKLIEQGKVVCAGVCNYSAEEMMEAEKYVEILTNQVPYSMVKRDIEKDVVPYCLEKGKGILPYSPLQRGILTGKISADYKFNYGDNRPLTIYYREPNLSRINKFLNELKPVAESYNATLSQLVIHWTMRQPGILSVLVGARNVRQVEENVKAARLDMDESHLNLISSKIDSLTLEKNIP
jgi:aryl-alcohol dehydrogenase-like predicted oxidoreductase